MDTNEIKIIGIGGAGNNVMRAILSLNIKNADYIVCNTDVQSLLLGKGQFHHKLQIGVETTKGKGSDRNVELGKLSVKESKKQIEQLFDKNSKTAIFIAGLGGGTGTGATPMMSKIAKDKGLFTIAIVHMPFAFESENTHEIANEGITELQKLADYTFVIHNDKIRKAYGNLSFKAGFGKLDSMIAQLLKMLISSGNTNDLKALIEKIQQGESVFIGFGESQGKFRQRKAIEEALKNALSDRVDIYGVKNIFVHICYGNTKVTIDEMDDIKAAVLQNAGNGANIIISVEEDLVINDSLSIGVLAS